MRALPFLLCACLAAFASTVSASEACYRERLDPQITRHYEAACAAFETGEIQRALAQIELVLLPHAKVYISAPPSCQLYKAALQGIEVWREALGEESFQLTSDPQDADIRIEFRRRLSCGDHHLCGRVEWKRKAVYSKNTYATYLDATIYVATHTGEGEPHDWASLVHIVAHELGHILGLDDSPDANDIMGPDLHGGASCRLSEGELAAIASLRARCRELRDGMIKAHP